MEGGDPFSPAPARGAVPLGDISLQVEDVAFVRSPSAEPPMLQTVDVRVKRSRMPGYVPSAIENGDTRVGIGIKFYPNKLGDHVVTYILPGGPADICGDRMAPPRPSPSAPQHPWVLLPCPTLHLSSLRPHPEGGSKCDAEACSASRNGHCLCRRRPRARHGLGGGQIPDHWPRKLHRSPHRPKGVPPLHRPKIAPFPAGSRYSLSQAGPFSPVPSIQATPSPTKAPYGSTHPPSSGNGFPQPNFTPDVSRTGSHPFAKAGVGIRFGVDKHNRVQIIDFFEGSPAHASRELATGDTLISVDGILVRAPV